MLTFFKFECYLTKYIFIINMKTFFKFIKIPIEIVTSGSPATFVFRRRNKLYKIINMAKTTAKKPAPLPDYPEEEYNRAWP